MQSAQEFFGDSPEGSGPLQNDRAQLDSLAEAVLPARRPSSRRCPTLTLKIEDTSTSAQDQGSRRGGLGGAGHRPRPAAAPQPTQDALGVGLTRP